MKGISRINLIQQSQKIIKKQTHDEAKEPSPEENKENQNTEEIVEIQATPEE